MDTCIPGSHTAVTICCIRKTSAFAPNLFMPSDSTNLHRNTTKKNMEKNIFRTAVCMVRKQETNKLSTTLKHQPINQQSCSSTAKIFSGRSSPFKPMHHCVTEVPTDYVGKGSQNELRRVVCHKRRGIVTLDLKQRWRSFAKTMTFNMNFMSIYMSSIRHQQNKLQT